MTTTGSWPTPAARADEGAVGPPRAAGGFPEVGLGEVAELAHRVAANVSRVLVGKPDVVRVALVTLLAEGHLLVEDVPGVGKTSLAKALALSIDCSVSRVQFTPDLLPGDITGMSIYNRQTEEFEFRPGPVFANVVIADEINRASPKTQSALLECMAEHQVTVDGVTYGLASPFLVVATQNPIEMDGTYPLPEAQRDRFTARVSVGYPDPAAELTMLDEHSAADPLEHLRPVADAPSVQAVIETVRRVRVGPEVRQYCVDLVTATRRLPDLRLGASPRATLQLVRTARAQAALHGRGYVVPDDVRAVAVPVLAHRLLLAPDARAARRSTAELVHGLLTRLPVPAPARSVTHDPDDTGPALPDGRRADRTVLSTRGRCVLAAGLATAACAIPLAERDLLRVGAFAAVLPLLALLLALATRRTVRVQRTLTPHRLAVGSVATVTLQVTGGTTAGPLELHDTAPDAAGAAAPPRFVVPPRTAGTAAAVRYPLHPMRRGVHRIGPLVAYGGDPLGLAEFARTVPGTERLLVLPRTVPLRGVPHALGSSAGAHGAGAAGSGQGRSDVLVRPYRSGDELRRVHWRSTARHDELMVRLEERPWRGGVTVLLDRRAGAHRGHGPGASLEWAVTFAASACVHLIERGEPVELVTEDGGSVAAPGSVPNADAVLDGLAMLRASARTDLGGPALPGSGDVLAVLGSTAVDDLPALLTRCPGQGHAVLLDVGSWGSGRAPVFTEGLGAPVEATAGALRAAGWAVTVAARGDRPGDVWDELVACPAPQAGVT